MDHHQTPRIALRQLGLLAALCSAMAGCGKNAGQAEPQLAASSGQVKPVQGGAVTRYAAARFADQVSFGATPALVAEIEAKGFSRWIDDQFNLPATTLNAASIKLQQPQDERAYRFLSESTHAALLSAPDQLRQRVVWALSQFLVVSARKINPYGTALYANMLQQHALGNYATLIREVSTSPAMGEYLDNLQNRPTSKECTSCAPNENYARELMQLFTLGVVKLNLDGSTVRDAQRRPLETYQQKDVEELARALTGWTFSNNPPFNSQGLEDHGRYEGKLVPDQWSATHDSAAKTVLGKPIPAGGNASADLDAAVAILMAHQNVAPFVSLRLIQHLVTSNPSPAYLERIARVFASSGGDLKVVVKAILLDPEARRGDVIGSDTNSFGKMREPLLWYTGMLRGLGCSKPLTWRDGSVAASSQSPYYADSVFSFYAPTDRAPGSNLLAPEQRLLVAPELASRVGGYSVRDRGSAQLAGCDAAPFAQAFAQSPQAFADLVGVRYFRAAMPVLLRQNLIDLAPEVYGNDAQEKALTLLAYALSTPYYGVIR